MSEIDIRRDHALSLKDAKAKVERIAEAIAERFGISVIGRHTALGDAIVTAEVFLKLIPLLAEKGIHTLGQARAAAERTYYARLKY